MSYPSWWNKTVTLYHKSEDDDGVIGWSRFVLTGVFVKNRMQTSVSGDTEQKGAERIVRIPQAECELPCCGDIIVPGVVSDVIDEYTSGRRSSDLLARYVESFSITSVTDNSFGSTPHYLIKG